MKLLYPILSILFLLSSQVCETPYLRDLVLADDLMDERPDSTLTVLENVYGQDTEGIERVQALYAYECANQKNKQLLKEKQQKEILLRSVCTVGILLLWCVLGAFFYLRRQKKKIKEQQCKLHLLKQQQENGLLRQAKCAINFEKLRMNVRFQFQKKTKVLNFKMTDKDWMDLGKQINEVYPDFFIKLINLHTKLTNTEVQVCMLVKIGIPNSEIATLMCLEKNSISSIRSRLYEKIHKEKGGAGQFDAFIREF